MDYQRTAPIPWRTSNACSVRLEPLDSEPRTSSPWRKTTEPLPTLYGSVKDYFEYLSGGEFTIVPKVLNPSNGDGYPMWLELG